MVHERRPAARLPLASARAHGGAGDVETTELIPLLADRGITLSAAQVYRLVAGVPRRLSLHTLAALCDILGCTPNDLVDVQRTNFSEPRPG
jgi:DNA-binding Xre family transcriptional regulator